MLTISQILLVHMCATWGMVGVIWFVQLVHYPLLGNVGTDKFVEYERLNVTRTGWVVIPLMLSEATTALLLAVLRPDEVLSWQIYSGLVLLLIIWLSTAMLQVPCHQQLLTTWDARTHRRLVRSNWIRTVAWTLRGLLAAAMM